MNKEVIHAGLQAYPIIVYDCPINKRQWKNGTKKGQSFASVFDDCWDCPFGKVIKDKKYFWHGTVETDVKILSVDCNGHTQTQTDISINAK